MTEPSLEPNGYDEFGLLHENVVEFGLEPADLGRVERVASRVHGDERALSGLVWGEATPDVVFVHGGAQNAHTWDTVALALGRPALAVDLPGHGHSDWRDDGAYTPANLADDIAGMIGDRAADAQVVVGMSLGGLASMELAIRHPGLVRSLVLVDITPGVNAQKAKAVIDFVDGPQAFPSFADLLARTTDFNPTRSESSLRRGILHNARRLDDGSWQWRYDRRGHARSRADDDVETIGAVGGASPLWDDFGSVTCPVALIRGSMSSVVDDEDVAEALRRQPDLDVHMVDGAGHSVQGDRPVELARLLERWMVGLH